MFRRAAALVGVCAGLLVLPAFAQLTPPTLEYPTGGITIPDTTPTLRWSGGSGHQSELVAIRKPPYGLGDVVAASDWLPITGTGLVTVTVSDDLDLGTTYRWNVVACSGPDGGGACVVSDDAVFSTTTVATSDIEVGEVKVFFPTVAADDLMTVTFQMYNTGSAPTPRFTTAIRVNQSSTSPDGPEVYRFDVPNEPGEYGGAYGPSFRSPLTPGTYYVWVVADVDGVITNESNKSNNVRRSDAFTVIPAGPLAPSQPTSPVGDVIVATHTPALTWSSGSNYASIQANVRRSPFGLGDVVYSSPWQNVNEQFGGVVAGGSVTVSPALAINTTYRWDVTSCSGSNGSGTCATSSTAQFRTPGPAVPDIAAAGVTAPASVESGAAFNVQWSINNSGLVAIPTTTTAIRINQDSAAPTSAPVLTVSTPPLNGGQTVGQQASVMAPIAPGTYYVWVTADHGGVITNQSTTANDSARSNALIVRAPNPKSDLVVQNISISPASSQPLGQITVNWDLVNVGAAASDATSTTAVRITGSATSPVGTTLQTVNTSIVNAGARISQNATLTAPATPGTYYVWILADSTGVVTNQSDATNDAQRSAAFVVQVDSRSDLVVQNVTVSPASPLPNGQITVAWDLVNTGSGATDAASTTGVRITTSGTSPAGASAQNVSTPILSAGSRIGQSATISAPGSPGIYYVWIVANTGRTVTNQSDEANDTARSQALVVGSPRLTVAPLSSYLPGTANMLALTVANAGSGAAFGYTAVADASWLQIVSGASGFTNGTIRIAVAANTGVERSGSITVHAPGVAGSPAIVSVTQAGATAPSPFRPGQLVATKTGPASPLSSSEPQDAPSAELFAQTLGVFGKLSGVPVIDSAGERWWPIFWDSTPPNLAGQTHMSPERKLTASQSGAFSQPDFTSRGYAPVNGQDSQSDNEYVRTGQAPTSTNKAGGFSTAALGSAAWYAYGRQLELGATREQLPFATGLPGAWSQQARTAGLGVDRAPRARDILQIDAQPAWPIGHAAVVEDVNPDGSVLVSESFYSESPASSWNFRWRRRVIALTDINLFGINFIHVPAATSARVVAAILPSARSVATGSTATAFATMLNSGERSAIGCAPQAPPGLPLEFSFQATDLANNPTGPPNTPRDIPAGAAQNFIIALTPSQNLESADVAIVFGCANTNLVSKISGVNTLGLSASTAPPPDIVAIAQTATGDGVLRLPGAAATGAIAAAAIDIGEPGTLFISADDGGRGLPVTLSICLTSQPTGACSTPLFASLGKIMTTNQVSTLSVFAQAAGPIPFDPARNRIFLRFKTADGIVRGGTSVAIRTD